MIEKIEILPNPESVGKAIDAWTVRLLYNETAKKLNELIDAINLLQKEREGQK